MQSGVPDATVQAFARTIHQEAVNYGFNQVDLVRLINALMDSAAEKPRRPVEAVAPAAAPRDHAIDSFPLRSARLRIRQADPVQDRARLNSWLEDDYGKHFLLSCSAAEQQTLDGLLAGSRNAIGVIELPDGTPIGAVAYLDIDNGQQRAELRKLIGEKSERGKGYAEEATALWLSYGVQKLGLQKIFVSTLQTHLKNIRLNEAVGFRVEGILRGETLLDGKRHDVLRMGYNA